MSENRGKEYSADDGGPLVVWQIVGKEAGHVAQTDGMVRLLKEVGGQVRVEQVEARPRIRGWQRSYFKKRLAQIGDERLLAWAGKRHCDLILPEGRPDIVMTSGGEGIWLLEALGRHFGAMKIYVGMPMAYPRSWVDVLASPMPDPSYAHVVDTGRLLTAMNEELVSSAALASGYQEREEGLWAVLIGGNSRSHQFAETDWKALGASLNTLGEQGIRFLLTTSRRTGGDVEAILKKSLKAEYLADAVWWSEEERKSVREFMGRSERVLVTRDSLTMLSEAIDSGREVVAVVPKESDLGPESDFTRYLQRLSDEGWVETVACEQLAGVSPMTSSSKSQLDFAEIAKELLLVYRIWRVSRDSEKKREYEI